MLESCQRPQQYPCLRLDPFDRGDDEDSTIEDPQNPLDFCDEVGVPGRVDQIDGHVLDLERHDGGSHRDAALSLDGKSVGLGVSPLDTSQMVYCARLVEQALGQAGLTGVNMSQDPKVQRFHNASGPLDSSLLS